MFQELPQSDTQRLILPIDKWMGKVDCSAIYSKDSDIKDKATLDKIEDIVYKISQNINYKLPRLTFIEEMDRIFLQICFFFDILLVALAMDSLFNGIKTYVTVIFIVIMGLYLLGKIGVLIFPEVIYAAAVDLGCCADMTKRTDILEVIQENKEAFVKQGLRWEVGKNCAWLELWMDCKNLAWQNMQNSRSKKED